MRKKKSDLKRLFHPWNLVKKIKHFQTIFKRWVNSLLFEIGDSDAERPHDGFRIGARVRILPQLFLPLMFRVGDQLANGDQLNVVIAESLDGFLQLLDFRSILTPVGIE
jgi:hypothetical protein